MKTRTINTAFQELKKSDPDTAMTLSGLRRLVNNGTVPSLRIGRRILIDYDNLRDYLSNPPAEQKEDDQYGCVRRIEK